MLKSDHKNKLLTTKNFGSGFKIVSWHLSEIYTTAKTSDFTAHVPGGGEEPGILQGLLIEKDR